VRISRAALEEIHRHAEEGYPYEICGIMIGPQGRREVTEVRRARNLNESMRATRYDMDPRDQLRVQREADSRGYDIVGYYHSHPDHPARASVTDAQHSWAGPIYLIVACHQGKIVDGNAFVADRDGGPMREEPLEVVQD
jgi:proteasome lid subunit RPN8/RPN11